MVGILLLGGKGSRLGALTKTTNKHMLPVGEIPMAEHSVRKMVEAGIKEIMIVTSPDHAGSSYDYFGSGHQFKCAFTYKVQDEPNGIAGALHLCKRFVGNEDCCVILGDNIFEFSLLDLKSKYALLNKRAMVVLNKVSDPTRFGVARFNANNELIEIQEKPKIAPSELAVIGIYFYDSYVFDIIPDLKKSDRGEFEISDVNNEYLSLGQLSAIEAHGFWSDAGTFESYKVSNEFVWSQEKEIMAQTKKVKPWICAESDSSVVKYIEYYPNTEAMFVTFTNDNIYQYDNVPENVAQEFFEAKSKGAYFSKNIKGKYQHEDWDEFKKMII